MGRRAAERKAAKLQAQMLEKEAIAKRRHERRAPLVRWLRRLVLALLVTIFLLYLGVVINQKLINAAGTTPAQPNWLNEQ